MAEHALLHATTVATVHDRRTGAAVCPLPTNDVEISWGRRLDRVSQAQVTIGTKGLDECCDCLANVGTWGHELGIYRNGELVWIGPIVDLDDDAVDFTFRISAEDRMVWMGERVLLLDLDYTGQGARDAMRVWRTLFEQADSADPVGLSLPTEVTTGVIVDKIVALGTEIHSAMRTVARDAINWSVVADRLYAGAIDDAYDIPTYEALTNEAWEDDGVSLIEAGKQLVTHVIVVGSNDVVGIHPNPIEPHPFWGLHEVRENDREILTNSDAKVRAQEIYESYNTTTPVYLSSNRSLGPGFSGVMADFVPGRMFSIAVDGTCRSYQIEQRLNALRVTAAEGRENNVRASFSPPGGRR